jgi:chromosome partitioning protein
MAIITAVGNRKGGVGKTAEVLGLATGLMLMRRKVLVIDLDPQADASTALEADGELDVFDVLYGGVPGSIGEAVTESSWRYRRREELGGAVPHGDRIPHGR